MTTSHVLRFPYLLLLAIAGCTDVGMFAEDVQPRIQQELVGKRAPELFAMYGSPYLAQIQQGHHVYYWRSISASSYTPTYSATTQGQIGGIPYSSTTTTNGDPQTNVTACVLVAGTEIDSDVIERVQLRGMNCGPFLKR